MPVFEEGDIFRTTIPLKEIATKKVGPIDTTEKTTDFMMYLSLDKRVYTPFWTWLDHL